MQILPQGGAIQLAQLLRLQKHHRRLAAAGPLGTRAAAVLNWAAGSRRHVDEFSVIHGTFVASLPLVAMHLAPSSILAPSSKARSP